MEDSEVAQRLVSTFQYYSGVDEIDATPTFIINGVKYSNMAYSGFQTAIDEAVEASMTE